MSAESLLDAIRALGERVRDERLCTVAGLLGASCIARGLRRPLSSREKILLGAPSRPFSALLPSHLCPSCQAFFYLTMAARALKGSDEKEVSEALEDR